MNFFEQFPAIEYEGVMVRDITRRVMLSDYYRNSPRMFLPYTVEEGQRPADIAHHYYGSASYVWLVLMSNLVIDPYYEWPMDSADFDKFLIAKYQEQSGKTGYEVIEWTMNQTIQENILYYQHKEDESRRTSPDSIHAPWFEAEEWRAVRIYDKEFEDNEARRHILLVDRKYTSIIDKQVKTKLNSGAK